ARTVELDAAHALDGLDVLLASGMVGQRQGRYGVRHPVIGTIVRDGLTDARRRRLHEHAALAYEADLAGPPRLAHAVAIARHYAAAGQPARGGAYAEKAAEWALAMSAPHEAVELYRRALAAEPTAARWLGLSRALYQLGEMLEARDAAQHSRQAS